MKNILSLAVIALLLSSGAGAQSTVDSIAAKYKLQPMPGPLTIEKTFPVLGAYMLNSAGTSGTSGTATGTTSATTGTTANGSAATGTVTTTTDTTTTSVNTAEAAAAADLVVALDAENKGIIWITGLPQASKIKAYLKKSPATYRIPAQKTEDGKSIGEGTLHFDTASRVLHVAFGKAYDEADPIAVFAPNMPDAATSTDAAVATDATMSNTNTSTSTPAVAKPKNTNKSKSKVTLLTAAKIEPAAPAAPAADAATQQAQQQPQPQQEQKEQQ
ncbi:MAG TPA: hypothetical protein VHK69_22545 [Chitinophagaceae bacterium]|nr:hypothetical protein [Chitinophagaceae bacterium]